VAILPGAIPLDTRDGSYRPHPSRATTGLIDALQARAIRTVRRDLDLATGTNAIWFFGRVLS